CRAASSSRTGSFVPRNPAVFNIQNVDGWFAETQTLDDSGVKILIRQETHGHVRFGLIWRRAASRRAKSSGFDLLSGGTDPSNSRWISARYSLIIFSFSR